MISDSYKKQLEQLHKENEDWGTGPRGNIIRICHWLYMNQESDDPDQNKIAIKLLVFYSCMFGAYRYGCKY